VPSESEDEPDTAEACVYDSADLPTQTADGRPDEGCPDLLGWQGNAYDTDPQYGVYAPSLDSTPGATTLTKTKVFVATLGDAGHLVTAPSDDRLEIRTHFVSESSAMGRGQATLFDFLLDLSDAAHVSYLILAPGGRTFLKAARHAMKTDAAQARVARGYDQDIRELFEATAASLPGWRILEITTGSSSYAT